MSSELRLVNNLIASNNNNLAASIATAKSEQSQIKLTNQEFKKDSEMLKALRGAGGNNLEYLMNEGESVKLRFEIEQLIESNIKVKDELVNDDNLGREAKEESVLSKKTAKNARGC